MNEEDYVSTLGGTKAEIDPLLVDCFIKTSLVDKALGFGKSGSTITRNIVVGKKGAGKSAIFRVGRGPRSRIPLLRISPRTHRVDVSETRLNYVHYADILKHEFVLECFGTWLDDKALKKKFDAKLRAQLQATVGDYKERIKNLAKRFAGIDISVGQIFGVGLSLSPPDKDLPPAQIVTKTEIASALELLRKATGSGAKCLVMIDDPELLFAPMPSAPEHLIGGLLLAAADLTYQFPGFIRIVVFLKRHIYDYLRRNLEDFGRLAFSFEMLKWTDAELGLLLTSRLETGMGVKVPDGSAMDPWSFLVKNGDSKPMPSIRHYLLERLISGPGDLILLAGLIIKFREDGLSGWEAVFAAESDYSEQQLDLLNAQYGGDRGFNRIDDVLRKLFDQEDLPVNGEWEPDLFVDFLRKRLRDNEMRKMRQQNEWLEALTAKSLASLLFDFGFLGYRSIKENRFVLPFETSSERRDFQASDRWRINPAFYKALGIPIDKP